ncbi:hypothetical protein [Rhizobium esperanzae]|uniref:hypothetical protein n=1 Tax=Rhizobium esperanzae TaxID=1967781 RepID=UPI001130B689|nr:hypothetical protein [Rhizobium esperanzae]
MQSPTTLAELLRAAASGGGKIDGVGLADDEIVKEAHWLGLVEVDAGNAWTMVDTVRLTPKQRVVMGLPPIAQRPSAVALIANAVTTSFFKLFGARRPLP